MCEYYRVPESVLKVKFDELLKVFMDILEKHGENANNYVLIKSVNDYNLLKQT